jgi:alkaline phosphatase
MSPRHAAGGSRPLTRILLTLVFVLAAVLLAARFAPWEIAGGDLVLRAKQGMTAGFPMPPDGLVDEVRRRDDSAPAEENRPRNVILMIGDGMGIGQLSAASAILHGPAGALALESAPVACLVRTYAGDNLTTDSGAASTAMATGHKVPTTVISTLPDGRVPVTLMEAAKTAGLATGLLTTSGLADATPAGFLVHAKDRYEYARIFSAILDSRYDVLIGGTWIHHHKAKHDEEYLELLDRAVELGTASGYHVVRDASDLAGTPPPVLALFDPRGSSASAHGPELVVTTEFLLESLHRQDAGFFALIENEVTDDQGHNNNVAGVVDAVREFDEAVRFAVGWAEDRSDTLILVTADHDTGGLGVVDGEYDDGVAEVRWASDNHTAQWVPLFAFGPGAEQFSGVIENSDIGVLIAKLLEIEDFPAFHP